MSLSEKRSPAKTLGSFKSISKFLGDAMDGLKGADFVKAVGAASPWLGAIGKSAGDALPPVKFVLSLFENAVAITDPNELAELAFSVSYEHAVEQAVEAVGTPSQPVRSLRNLQDSMPDAALDFSHLTYDQLLLHPFIQYADGILDSCLEDVGYDKTQRLLFQNEVHKRFVTHFKTLISHGDTIEKFSPLREILARDGSSEAALLEHAQYQRALYEERPVFGKEVFALRHVYIDTECGVLKWGEIRDESTEKDRIDPFDEEYGGRHRLGAEVLRLIADPTFNDAIVIQGVAGAGKSAFTQWLSAELVRRGLRPIRVLLRDVRLERNRPIVEALGEAIRYDDESRRSTPGYPRPAEPFKRGAIFNESVQFDGAAICPYVLILDGWDEISISVSEGFKVRLDKMLEQIRSEFLRPGNVRIRVILTGRPSADVANSPFLLHDTPILTLRSLNADDLQTFVDRLSQCIVDPPIKSVKGTNWPAFDAKRFKPIIDRYRKEPSTQLEVLGLPLLALLAVRLLSRAGADPDEILANPTVLYRNLVDLTCGAAGKSEDAGENTDHQFRLTGSPLRDLLRRTAAALTVHGKENISYDELQNRLADAIHDLDKRVEKEVGDNVLSQLMISYFFKGGHKELGCEFLHKAFREYLYAEGIVETLKRYGRDVDTDLPPRTPYWKDFDVSDRRYRLSRDLSTQLAAQWLRPEVVAHLEVLLEWEISRPAKKENAQETSPLPVDGWRRVRDGLADVWGWWAEGVHLRPQPHLDNRRDPQFANTYAEQLIKETCVPLDLPKGKLPEPPRTVVVDSHLGDALFRLAAWTHFFVAKRDGWLRNRKLRPTELWAERSLHRQHQTKVLEGYVLFRPAGDDHQFWSYYTARIDAAGWRPDGHFPRRANCSGLDLALSSVKEAANFSYANLTGANLERAALHKATFEATLLTSAHMALIFGPARFAFCDMDRVGFHFAYCVNARFTNCSLSLTRFVGTSLLDSRFVRCQLARADFSEANLQSVQFVECSAVEATVDGALINNKTVLPTNALIGYVVNVDAALSQATPPSSSNPEEPPARSR